MAAKAIVGERKSIAIGKIQEHVAAISAVLGIEPGPFGEHVPGGDEPYKEMVRTEQMADLLGAIRDKVATRQDAVTGTPPVELPGITKPRKTK